MFTVYSEKDIFENIIVFNEETPHWYSIFRNHADVCLNITPEELLSEQVQGTPIFEFIMANGGRSPIALSSFFEDVYDDNSIIATKPRSAFFLNYSKVDADALQSSYGVIVHGNSDIEDKLLKGSFFKDLPKNSVYENETTNGWKNLINFSIPPSNALVITDEYLFSNEERGQIVGVSNIIQLLDAIMPESLDIPYHLTIVTDDHGKSADWCKKVLEELKIGLDDLRPYDINTELVFTQTIHKRKLLLNYANSTCDKGFSVFKAGDGKTVRDSNDFRFDRIFNRVDPQEGDTDYFVVESVLLELKRICDSVTQFIVNSGPVTNKRILGDFNADMTLKNRLINDV